MPTNLKGTLGDVRIRRALSMALDRTGIIKAGAAGVGTPAKAPAATGAWAVAPAAAKTAYAGLPEPARDVAGAKKLVREAGATGRRITMATSTLAPEIAVIASAVQSAGREIGLDVRLKTVAPDAYTALFSDPKARAGLDLVMTTWYDSALWWERDRGAEQIPELLARRGGAGRFRAGTVKIMQDGVAENFTAAMTSAYLDGCGRSTGNRGLSFVDPGRLQEYVTLLDAAGFQVHVHAVGDRAVREALDAFARARTINGPGDNRHHIAHLQVVHPDDVPRFAALGVTANIQPLWAAHEPRMDELTIPFLGPERASWQYPFGRLDRTGAALAAGSDWPVSSPDPLWGLHVAVNRVAPGEDTEEFLPEQRLDLAKALTAYTLGSARVNHLDAETGTIEVGKYADLVVLDADPFTVPAERLAEVTVKATFVEGEQVHPDPLI
ncbi:amidohydrolase family protein [Actinomadura violacea]|uniref:amidohydrolase family protein n=1 Tax=Actinomadura violacea TaxID=2819934 RepID=UPI003557C96B